MNRSRLLLVAAPLVFLAACTGGGGSSSVPAGPAWEKFRHDVNNTGLGNGSVFPTATPHVTWRIPIDATPTPGSGTLSAAESTGQPISSSPAIAGDGTVYVGSEGGTLAAVNPSGVIKWTRVTCEACPVPPTPMPPETPQPTPPGGDQSLGPLLSSPAIFTLSGITNVFIGSMNGRLLIFQDNTTTGACTACFRPNLEEFGIEATAHFISSPTFTVNASSGNISGIFIGARIDNAMVGNTTRTVGKLYAINGDGSLKWEFPARGAAVIGPITSSPVLGGNTLYITAADTIADSSAAEDGLYAIINQGTLNDGTPKWRAGIGRITDPGEPTVAFVSSPLASAQIFLATADGNVLSILPDDDGAKRWETSLGGVFIASLALGNPAILTSPTPTPTATIGATNTPPSAATATPTPTAPMQSVFGVSKEGVLVAIDVATGHPNLMSNLGPTVGAPVVSSPALSTESILIFGDGRGVLHAFDTSTGQRVWAVTLAPGVPIRSSPALASDGTIYVGADDGMLYAVRTQ